MILPVKGIPLQTNDLRAWCYIAAVAVFVGWALLRLNPSWAVTIVIIGALAVLPGIIGYLWSKRPLPKDAGPKHGGDIRLWMGKGVNGGRPGRLIVTREQTDAATPFVILNDQQNGGTLFVYSGPKDPTGLLDAPMGSLYLQLAKGHLPAMFWKEGETNEDWKAVLHVPTH